MRIVEVVLHRADPFRGKGRRRDEVGASLVEYALLLALIAVVAIVSLHFLGGSVSNSLNSSGNSLFGP